MQITGGEKSSPIWVAAGAGEAANRPKTRVTIEDRGAPVTAGSGCTQVSDNVVTCTGYNITAQVDTGDRDDEVTGPGVLRGGAGNDRLTGTYIVYGGDGDDILAGLLVSLRLIG